MKKDTIDPADVDDDEVLVDTERVIESDCSTRLGINAVTLAGECRAKWFEFTGQPASENPDALERWTEAVEMVFALCEGEIERSFSEAARVFQHKATDQRREKNQPPILDCMWEAAVRHAVNVIMAEDANDLHDARAFDWREWILTKSKQEKDHGEEPRESDE